MGSMRFTAEFQARVEADISALQQGLGSCEPTGVITHSGSTFFFSKDVIVIAGLENWYNVWRRVYMDGRAHPDDLEPSYFGHSIGHWEGDTLVVHTVGIRREARMGITTAVGNYDTEVLERFRLLDDDTLEIQRTISNPEVLVEPHESTRILRRTDVDFHEAYCWTDRDEVPGGDLTLR